MEVLFDHEWQEYRSIIKSKRSEMLDRITETFVSFSGKRDIQIHTLQSNRKAKGKQGKCLLQRYVNNWKAYINVDNIDLSQVKNRDSLTITQPSAPLSNSSTDPSPSQNTTKVHSYNYNYMALSHA